jgi:hypothetical protein
MRESQTAAAVLLIAPARFSGNPQTCESNRFQGRMHAALEKPQGAALLEFKSLVLALERAGITTCTFQDTVEPEKPDAIFPNNWVSFHRDGTVVLYPMMAPNRRVERRMDLLHALGTDHGFRISRVVDLSHHERGGRFLEGTGSLVLDRVHRIAYACLSPRTNLGVLEAFAQQLEYELLVFQAHDAAGFPIYHTNVLMGVGSRFAAVCSTAILSEDRSRVLASLESTGHQLLDLSCAQMSSFAGNLIELDRGADVGVLVMSAAAFESLKYDQVRQLQGLDLEIVAVAIPTIERWGGGSVRCMIAEIHLEQDRDSRG